MSVYQLEDLEINGIHYQVIKLRKKTSLVDEGDRDVAFSDSPIDDLQTLGEESDLPKDPNNVTVEEAQICDYVFGYGNEYYLLPNDNQDKTDFNLAQSRIAVALVNDPYELRTLPKFRQRLLKQEEQEQNAGPLMQALALGPVTTLSPQRRPYRPGTFLTGTAATAGAMTLANYLANRYTEGATSYLGGDKLIGSLGWDAALKSVLLIPAVAATATFSLNYMLNNLAYMAENNGARPSAEVQRRISEDSWKRAIQIFAGFALIEGAQTVMAEVLGKSVEKAWGSVSSSTGGASVVLYPAVMLSVGVAVGLGMALGSLVMQLYQKRDDKNAQINWAEVGQALFAGVAGAVSTIDFGNRGLSFLATWAALSFIPAAKATVDVGEDREALFESYENMKATGTHCVAYFSSGYKPVDDTLFSQDDIDEALKQHGTDPNDSRFSSVVMEGGPGEGNPRQRLSTTTF